MVFSVKKILHGTLNIRNRKLIAAELYQL